MAQLQNAKSAPVSYHNPVFSHDFPDPFVLKHAGQYWAYCTGFWHDGRCFGILRSSNLIDWEVQNGALEPLPENYDYYWAAEVCYYQGQFWMYYSVGVDDYMHLRVAVADHPGGPFVDCGRHLTQEKFAIDAHVFTDSDGQRYIFYATDFTEHEFVGTGTVVDRLIDPLTLEGHPQAVTLPRYDWHVFDPARVSKGGVRWHTIEGSFVLKRKGRYYQMFSGGNWQNTTYGVSYALSDKPMPGHEWQQVADGRQVLPILRSIPNEVVGPGHNSVVRGPDNRQQFCVYHRWLEDEAGRAMAIDKLDWAGERMLILGPTTEAQPVPNPPSFSDYFDTLHSSGLGSAWKTQGNWRIESANRRAIGGPGSSKAELTLARPFFLAEVTAQPLQSSDANGSYGLGLYQDDTTLLRLRLRPTTSQLEVEWQGVDGRQQQMLNWPAAVSQTASQLIRVEQSHSFVKLSLEGFSLWQGRLKSPSSRLTLEADGAETAFSSFELTYGSQDEFDATLELAALGWQSDNLAAWNVRDQILTGQADNTQQSLFKPIPGADYELVINATLLDPTARYGFYPASSSNQPGPLLKLATFESGWVVEIEGGASTARWQLPASFDPSVYQQFRLVKQAGQLAVSWEGTPLGRLEVDSGPTYPGLYAQNGRVGFDIVRLTILDKTQ